jgi:Protein of unknown function (DUF3618)
MAGEPRTTDQIREEIRVERAQLDASVAALQSGATSVGKRAGSAMAALSALMLVRRLRKRRKD